MALFTVGHSTRAFEELVEMLVAHGVTRLVDVRTVPKSRRHPHFAGEALARSLPERGIAYAHAPALGGLRKPRKDSPNLGWRNESFRGYADHMLGEKFGQALTELLAAAARENVAVMCAEAVPWRCHRNLIADAATVRGVAVEHIMDAGTSNRHALTKFARVEDGRLVYPAEET